MGSLIGLINRAIRRKVSLIPSLQNVGSVCASMSFKTSKMSFKMSVCYYHASIFFSEENLRYAV